MQKPKITDFIRLPGTLELQTPARAHTVGRIWRGGNRNTTLRDSFAWPAMPGETTHPAEYRHKFGVSCVLAGFLAPPSLRAGKPIKTSKFPFVTKACALYPHCGLITALKTHTRKQYYTTMLEKLAVI
jgi:hypothetical protein